MIALWLDRGSMPGRGGRWGGAATLSFDTQPLMFRSVDAERVTLDLPGRSAASIVVVESSGRRIVFIGNGPYPDERICGAVTRANAVLRVLSAPPFERRVPISPCGSTNRLRRA